MYKIFKRPYILFLVLLVMVISYFLIGYRYLSIPKNISNTSSSELVLGSVVEEDSIEIPDILDNHVFADRFDLEAPIIWDIKNTEEETDKNLKKGVVHLEGTAKPGEKGNILITGHSSDYLWSDGKYKQVFLYLDKLVSGDKVFISHEGKTYGYKVVGSKVVKPDDASVFEQGNGHTLSLITCTPPGTTLNRLVVTAEQFYPLWN